MIIIRWIESLVLLNEMIISHALLNIGRKPVDAYETYYNVYSPRRIDESETLSSSKDQQNVD